VKLKTDPHAPNHIRYNLARVTQVTFETQH